MLHKSIQQETDLWESWIEFDMVSENSFGTFYIIGEARVKEKSRQPIFVKQMDPHIPGRVNLYLQNSESQGKLSEVIYAEPVSSLHQYRSVAVFSDGVLVAEINHIEIMV